MAYTRSTARPDAGRSHTTFTMTGTHEGATRVYPNKIWVFVGGKWLQALNDIRTLGVGGSLENVMIDVVSILRTYGVSISVRPMILSLLACPYHRPRLNTRKGTRYGSLYPNRTRDATTLLIALMRPPARTPRDFRSCHANRFEDGCHILCPNTSDNELEEVIP